VGQVDYEEWFESVDIGSVPLGAVAYVVADLYRDLFEVCVPRARPFLLLDLIGGGSGYPYTESWTEDPSGQPGMADSITRR
jgi:hypothetical protein